MVTILVIFGIVVGVLVQKEAYDFYKDHKFKQGLIWECPSFVSKHYNCLQPFENSTGKYCGTELVCQNQWEEERK